MPVVSAIIPKLYKNPCDFLLIIYFKSLNTMLRKQARKSCLKWVSWTVSLLLAHDGGRKIWNETVKCHLGLDQHTRRAWWVCSSNEYTASHAQHNERHWLLVLIFSSTPQFQCHSSVHFHSVFTAFLPSGTFTATTSSNSCDKSSHFC